MDASLLRLLVTAAARGAERGTLLEIVETAERLIALLKPLLAPGGAAHTARPVETGPR